MKKTLMFAWVFAVIVVNSFGQIERGPRLVHPKEKSGTHVPAQDAPVGLTKIYSNLGSKTDAYSDVGEALIGATAPEDYPFFIGMPFTPKYDSHVSQVQVAVQYQSGANQVNLSIYEDSGGIPGTLLAGPVTVTNLPDFPTCCLLTVANFSPLAVTGGTRYWVVADTPSTGTGSNFTGAWCQVVKPFVPIAFYFDGSWVEENAYDLVAGEVLGTIP